MIDKKTIEVILKLKDRLSGGLKTAATKAASSAGRISRSAKKIGASFKAAALSVKGLVAAFIALAALRQVIIWMKESINLAAIQEAAINKLESAMKAVGQFTVEGSKDLQNFASKMQRLTTVGDETTLAMLGTLRTLTKLDNEGLKKAAQSAIGLAKVMGINVQNAALTVGKSIGSNVNALIRFGVELDTTATQQEKATQLLKGTAAMFEVAKGEVNTFTGAVTQLGNIWGDLRESLGFFVAESPGVIAVIKEIGKQIGLMGDKIDVARGQSDDLAGKSFAALITGSLEIIVVLNEIATYATTVAIGLNKVGMAVTWLGRSTALALGRITLEEFNAYQTTIDDLEETLVKMVGTDILLENIIEDINKALEGANFTVKEGESLWDLFKKKTEETSDALGETKDAILGLTEVEKTHLDSLNNTIEALLLKNIAFRDPAVIQAMRDIQALTIENNKLKDSILGVTESLLEQVRALPKEFGLPIYPLPEGYLLEQVRALPSEFGLPAYPPPKDPDRPVTPAEYRQKYQKQLTDIGFSAFQNIARGGGIGQSIAGTLPAIGGVLGGMGTMTAAFGALGGPVGMLLGGIAGSLLGGLFKKKRRGETPAEPVFTSDVNLQNSITELLNAVKSQLIVRAAGGTQRISVMLREQALSAGFS